MQTVNIDDARRHFCRLVDAAANGEELPLRKPASPLSDLEEDRLDDVDV
jgi:antitoxin (DNA-binding transcriptional repressor) of toxin-antitoxin stability system